MEKGPGKRQANGEDHACSLQITGVVAVGVPFVKLQIYQSVLNYPKMFSLTKMRISTTVKMILPTLRIVPTSILAMCGLRFFSHLARNEDKSFPSIVCGAWTKWRQPREKR